MFRWIKRYFRRGENNYCRQARIEAEVALKLAAEVKNIEAETALLRIKTAISQMDLEFIVQKRVRESEAETLKGEESRTPEE